MALAGALLFASVGALVVEVPAANAQSVLRDPQFLAAREQFNRESPRSRVVLQVLLVAGGHTNAIATGEFGSRTFEAVKSLQAQAGLPVTGAFDAPTQAAAYRTATPLLRMWGFAWARHPDRPVRVWVPNGLALTREVPTRSDGQRSLTLTSSRTALRINLTTFANISVADLAAASQALSRSRGRQVHYHVARADWTVTSQSGDGDHYDRFHRDGSNVTGFMLTWGNDPSIHGERIAVLMSSSLYAAMQGSPFFDPLDLGTPRERPALEKSPSVAATVPPAAPTYPPAASSTPTPAGTSSEATPVRVSTGSGFFVGADGAIVTNAHVVEGCSSAQVRLPNGSSHSATIRARDAINDLALLTAPIQAPAFGSLRTGLRLGEAVAAFGFPHSDLLASSGNFTLGNVTALSGLGDDSRNVQVSAPVQAGNSGGPLVDRTGNVVGVVTSKLNALRVARNGGDLPQNVNFAVKASLLLAFLESNGVTPETAPSSLSGPGLDPADLADRAKAISVYVTCRKPS